MRNRQQWVVTGLVVGLVLSVGVNMIVLIRSGDKEQATPPKQKETAPTTVAPPTEKHASMRRRERPKKPTGPSPYLTRTDDEKAAMEERLEQYLATHLRSYKWGGESPVIKVAQDFKSLPMETQEDVCRVVANHFGDWDQYGKLSSERVMIRFEDRDLGYWSEDVGVVLKDVDLATSKTKAKRKDDAEEDPDRRFAISMARQWIRTKTNQKYNPRAVKCDKKGGNWIVVLSLEDIGSGVFDVPHHMAAIVEVEIIGDGARVVDWSVFDPAKLPK